MADNAKKLYDALTAKGVPLGDYNLYSQKIQDPTNRKKLFDVATSSGVPVGDFQTFESKLGSQSATQQPSDLSKRIDYHEKGSVPATKFRRPVKLIHSESYLDKAEAFNRERFLKSLWGSRFKKKLLKKYLNKIGHN